MGTLVEKGCSTRIVSTKVSKSTDSVCVSFQLVRISTYTQECNGSIYIHASMSDCASYTKCPGSNEYTACGSRRKRQLQSNIEEVYGPTIVMGSHARGAANIDSKSSSVRNDAHLDVHESLAGKPSSKIGGQDSDTRESDEDSKLTIYTLAAMLATLLVFSFVLSVAFYRSRRRKVSAVIQPYTIENYSVLEYH